MNERGEWRLSPAYDLLPSYGFGGQHTTTVNGSGLPTHKDMLAVADAAGIAKGSAKVIIESILLHSEHLEIAPVSVNEDIKL
jgi:serine/threonine-protein kinase HipA